MNVEGDSAIINRIQYILPLSESSSPCDAVGSSSGFLMYNTLGKDRSRLNYKCNNDSKHQSSERRTPRKKYSI